MRRSIRRGLIAIATLLLTALIVGPQLIDREVLRKTLIEQLSTALGRPVDIAHLDVRFLPLPTITLEKAVAALGEYPEDTLKIGRIRATLDARALLARQIRFTQIEIDSLTLNDRLFESLRRTTTALSKGASGGSVDIRLQQAKINGLTWTMGDGLQLGPFTAMAEWQNDSLPHQIIIEQQDSRLQASISFSGPAIDVHLQAHEWVTPVYGPLRQPLQIADLQAQARYTEGQLEIHNADLTGAVGQLRMSGRLAWRDSWRFDGKLAGDRIDLPILLGSFGRPTVPGQAGGECVFELQATDATHLFNQPVLDCKLRHAHAGKEAQLTLKTHADADALKFIAQARNLTLPQGPMLHFDALDLTGKYAREKITFHTAQAIAYQGVLNMQGDLSWDTGWQWNFTAQSRKLRLDPLLAVFDQHNLDGHLDADCKGRLAGKAFNGLFQQPGLNCNFTLTKGVLRDTDLEKAARLIKLDSKTAGDTPFDHLSGNLHMQDGHTQFTGLKLRSTALEAKGDVGIDRDKKLSGEITAGVKNTGGMASVPLVVSGTVADPVIRPTTSAMAGGAAGTVLLGPGVGTAVGVKVGEAFSKMTGWLKPKSRTQSGQE